MKNTSTAKLLTACTLILSSNFAVAQEAGLQPDGPQDAPQYPTSPAHDPDSVEHASKNEDHAVAILVDPLTTIVGAAMRIIVIKPEIQIKMNDYLALDVRPAYASYLGGNKAFGEDIEVSGGGGDLGLRIAPMGTGLEGLYVVPRVGIAHVSGSSKTESITSTAIAPTAEVGYAWAFGNFMMNAGGGAGYAFVVDGHDVYENSPVGGLQIVANFSVGFGF